jgi:hypothetical protein
MEDYKKVMLSGLKESFNLGKIYEEEVDCIKEAIEDTYAEMIEELDSRLGLELYDYKVEIKYDQDRIPQSYKHTLLVKFNESEGAIKMNFRGVLTQLKEILSTGDDEVLVGSCNLGLVITIKA